jgi:hypothetical protein
LIEFAARNLAICDNSTTTHINLVDSHRRPDPSLGRFQPGSGAVCLRVHNIGEGAKLKVAPHGVGFVKQSPAHALDDDEGHQIAEGRSQPAAATRASGAGIWIFGNLKISPPSSRVLPVNMRRITSPLRGMVTGCGPGSHFGLKLDEFSEFFGPYPQAYPRRNRLKFSLQAQPSLDFHSPRHR